MARKRGPRPEVVNRIARTIQARLTSGEYAPDTYLPSERQLAQDLKTSRASVAAAIQNLSQLGLVDRHPGRGSYIRPRVEKSICIVHTLFPGSNLIWAEAVRTLQGARDGLGVSSFSVEEIKRSEWHHAVSAWCEKSSALLLVELDDEVLPAVRAVVEKGFPCVVANLEQDYPDLPASFIDHRGIVQQATSLLIGMGHRRIGYVGNEPQLCFYASALAGYERALCEANIAVDPQMIELQPGTMALVGYLGARALLSRPNAPTAIVAARDGYAEGVCKAAEEAGLIVGRDLSVIGYDDLTWPASRDFLTTFAYPGAELGEAAARMLLQWVISGERPANQKIETPIIMRRSVGPAH